MRVYTLTILSILLLVACQDTPDPEYVDSLLKWRSERVDFLKSEAGFVNLAGLDWFSEGPNTLGSGEENDVVLPTGLPAQLATIEWVDKYAFIKDIKDEGLQVDGIAAQEDTIYGLDGSKVLSWGSYRLYVIKRADKLGLRIKNFEHPRLKEALDIPYYTINEDWRVTGRFEPYDPPKTLMIQNIVGLTYPVESPGRLVFEVDGETYALDPSLDGEKFYITFGDETNGEETYGSGRYLYADRPDANGNVILDFNKAYNPPCAFTEYATCPLPPSQNRLALNITAGEQTFHWEDEEH